MFSKNDKGSFDSRYWIILSEKGVSNTQLITTRTMETEPTAMSVNQWAPDMMRGSEKMIKTSKLVKKALLPKYFPMKEVKIRSIIP